MIIAADIFWCVAFLISVVYIKDPTLDLGFEDGQITNAFEKRQEERNQRQKERQMKAQMNRELRQQRKGKKGQKQHDEIAI